MAGRCLRKSQGGSVTFRPRCAPGPPNAIALGCGASDGSDLLYVDHLACGVVDVATGLQRPGSPAGLSPGLTRQEFEFGVLYAEFLVDFHLGGDEGSLAWEKPRGRPIAMTTG